MEVYTNKKHDNTKKGPIARAIYNFGVKMKEAFPDLFTHEETMVFWNGNGYAYDPAHFGIPSNYRGFETFREGEENAVLIPTVSRAAQETAMGRTPKKK